LSVVAGADWIALYAAVVATGSLAWQVASRILDRRPRLRVNASLTFFIADETATQELAKDLSLIAHQPWRLQLDVLNIGHSEVRISRAYFNTLRTPGSIAAWAPQRWELPWLLQSGEEHSAFITDDDAGELVMGQEFVAIVVTTRGTEFRSEPISVDLGKPQRSVLVAQPYTVFKRLTNTTGVEPFVLELSEFRDDEG
jgi:hypothetical protein